MRAIFFSKKLDSVNGTVPGDIKTSVQFPGNPISPRNFNPREIKSSSSFAKGISRQKMLNFLGHFSICIKILSGGFTYSNAHAKVKNWIFDVYFPGNWFSFGIISNDFWSSTIWVIQIQVSISEFKNPENPGIQPIYNYIFSISSGSISCQLILTIVPWRICYYSSLVARIYPISFWVKHPIFWHFFLKTDFKNDHFEN